MLFSHYSWGFETTVIRLTNCGMYYGEGACDKCFLVTLDSKSRDRLDWRNKREYFLYQYDFTAGWELEIRLENILPFDPARSYPICIGGKRTGPPEHCVGAWAYLEWRDQYVFHPPLEDLSFLADAVSKFLESGESAHGSSA
jgi:pRiA4b ORF-3-like protein